MATLIESIAQVETELDTTETAAKQEALKAIRDILPLVQPLRERRQALLAKAGDPVKVAAELVAVDAALGRILPTRLRGVIESYLAGAGPRAGMLNAAAEPLMVQARRELARKRRQLIMDAMAADEDLSTQDAERQAEHHFQAKLDPEAAALESFLTRASSLPIADGAAAKAGQARGMLQQRISVDESSLSPEAVRLALQYSGLGNGQTDP